MTIHQPAGAQTAQNEPGAIQAQAPRPNAPMSFAEMVEKLQPAVVNISTTQRVEVPTNPFAGTPFGEFFGNRGGGGSRTQEAESLGSGFVISDDGYVVTNNHVVAPGNARAVVESITVTLSDGREYEAQLVGRDAQSDLAVLKIDGDGLPFVRFGDSTAARVGDWVVAIGNPFGLGGTVTAGIISAVHRVTGAGAYDRFIQTDASINRGNSGGPMFDLNGNVIGINSQIYSPTGGNVGIGFAIPAEEAKPVIDTLIAGGEIKRGYLGVQMQDLSDDLADALGVPKGKGTLIARVEPGEAAAKAGLKAGDLVVKVGGKDVTPDQTLSYLVANIEPGKRVPVEVIREGERRTFQVTLGTRPSEEELAGFDPNDDSTPPSAETPDSAAASLGLIVRPLTPQIARSVGIDPETEGVVVLRVDPSSAAGQQGLRRGDVITSANRKPVKSPQELAEIVTGAKQAGNGTVVVYIQRGRAGRFVPLQIDG
ncbi:Do family serine endopeptidase [Stakelama tenebrarum]|nr:Do family serine endopeptidase [Sphingosinithalassobacter tenebrarum]